MDALDRRLSQSGWRQAVVQWILLSLSMMLIGFATGSAFGSGPPTLWPVLLLIAGGSIFAAAALAAVAALIVRARPPESAPSQRGVTGMLTTTATSPTAGKPGTPTARPRWRNSGAVCLLGAAGFLAGTAAGIGQSPTADWPGQYQGHGGPEG
jgi:hypothetical protein